MKKLWWPLLAVFMFLAGCATKEKLMSRYWRVYDVKFGHSTSFPPEQQQLISNQIKTNIRIKFSIDSSYRVTNDKDTVGGKWWFNKTKTAFTTANDRMGEVVSGLIKLDSKVLVYSSVDASGDTIIFSCSPEGSK